MIRITNPSQSISNALLDATQYMNAQIRTKLKVNSIKKGADKLFHKHLLLENRIERFDSLILAMGLSRVGYNLAKEVSYTIIDPVPSLFTFNVAKT